MGAKTVPLPNKVLRALRSKRPQRAGQTFKVTVPGCLGGADLGVLRVTDLEGAETGLFVCVTRLAIRLSVTDIEFVKFNPPEGYEV